MTMSLTLVNTSNWEHEEYVIEGGKIAYIANGQLVDTVRLKPGEKVVIYPDKEPGTAMRITAIQEDETPFYAPCINKDGTLGKGQTWPEVSVTFREPGK